METFNGGSMLTHTHLSSPVGFLFGPVRQSMSGRIFVRFLGGS